jgi:hypothetical protein
MPTRAFYKSLHDLLKLRAETRKAEIGFEAQKLKQSRAVETLELRKQVFKLAKRSRAKQENPRPNRATRPNRRRTQSTNPKNGRLTTSNIARKNKPRHKCLRPL